MSEVYKLFTYGLIGLIVFLALYAALDYAVLWKKRHDEREK